MRQINDQIHQHLFELSQLKELSQLTFETYLARGSMGLPPRQAESVEYAYNTAKLYAQSLNGWLLLMGGYGCGKTHLAAAIANFAVSLGVPALFLTVPDLLDSLRFAFDDPQATFEERFEEIRRVNLLVLDDFGTHNATPWAQEKLFQIINYRYINNLSTVITTNLLLDQIEPRIRSRLEDEKLVNRVTILAGDFRRPATDHGHHELSSLQLLNELTFEKFDFRKNEKLSADEINNLMRAYEEAQDFAQRPSGWLMFLGDHGCGKTHLAAAIGNYRQELGDQPIFVSVPEMLDELRSTFNPESSIRMDRRFEEYKTAPILILDALGTQSSTPWAREKLYQLFDYRYFSRLPTVITTQVQIEDLDSHLRSRLLDTRLCTLFAITAPDYRGGGQRKPRPKTSRRTTPSRGK